MALKGAFVWFYSAAVLSFSAAQDETTATLLQNCSSQTQLFERLSADLKMAADCGESLSWGPQQTASLLLSIRDVTDALHKHQLKECRGAEPQQCPEAEVPENGALACVSVDNKRYCKPLCNHGYDFGFMRRSRLFDECSLQTGYKWATQYVGGNKLAVCIESSIQVSGAKTAYFPQDQDCQTTKSIAQLQDGVFANISAELKSQGVPGDAQHACLRCG